MENIKKIVIDHKGWLTMRIGELISFSMAVPVISDLQQNKAEFGVATGVLLVILGYIVILAGDHIDQVQKRDRTRFKNFNEG